MNNDDELLIDNFIDCNSYNLDEFLTASKSFSTKGIKILHLNINGCPTNFDEFSAFLTTLSFNYAVIALTETHLTKNTDFNFELDNYRSINNYSKHGIKIFYDKTLNITPLTDLNYNDEFKETLFVKFKQKDLGILTFGVVYRSHSSTIEQFNTSFAYDVLDRIHPRDPVILTGDFNINLAIEHKSPSVQQFANIMLEHNLYPSVDKITRYNHFNPENSTIIDHFWSRNPFPYSTHVISANISDHYIIALHTDIPLLPQLVNIKFRDFSIQNIDSFCADLPELISHLNLDYNLPEECTNHFIEWIMRLFDRYFPIKTKTLSLKRLKAPWLTDKLLTCIKKKHKFYLMFKQGIITKKFYNDYRNLLTFAIRKTKQKYYQNCFVNAEKNVSKMWKLINNFMNKSKHSSLSSIRGTDNSIVSNVKQVANVLNDSFVNVAVQLRHNLPTINNNRTFDDFPSNAQSIFLIRTTPHETEVTIASFENKNNSIADLPFRILKIISPILTNIFNSMVSNGIYPTCLKSACVTPLFKSGDSLNPRNYRPISVLKSINKIFERLLLHRLNSFTSTYNIMSNSQYGFTCNRGINDALFDLLGSIREALLSSNYCIAVFCDFSKAFDTLDNQRLLMKLSRYGIRGNALSLIKSYLSNRSQTVVLDGIASEPMPLSNGVPQGSILGSWLFNIYINDLAHYIHDHSPVQYADDTTLFNKNKCIDLLIGQMQNTLNLFLEWSLANFLSLNSSKTKYMLFSNTNFIGPLFPLTINNDLLERVSNVKFLGIYIDDSLNYREDIRILCSKLSRLVGLSYAIGPSLDLAAAKSFYFGLAQSLLMYAIIFWGATFHTDIQKVQICQNKIIRNLFNGKINYTSTSNLFAQLKILKVKELHRFESCQAIYKSLNCNLFLPFRPYLNDLGWGHDYGTRGMNSFRVPRVSRTREQHDFLFQSVHHWNNLPLQIRNSSSLGCFKNQLRNNLLSTYD